MSAVVVYGDLTLNIIDGSSVWLTSISGVLAQVVDEVHVVLKQPLTNDRLSRTLTAFPNIKIHDGQKSKSKNSRLPSQDARADSLTPKAAALRLEEVMKETNADLLMVRGLRVCHEVSRRQAIASKLWAYVTDLPYPISTASPKEIGLLRKISSVAWRMLVQTESGRSYLESMVPEAAGKTLLLPPMVPQVFFAAERNRSTEERPLRLVYAGKFAEDWRTLEMLQLPGRLREMGTDCHLYVIGDKFQRSKSNAAWSTEMEAELQEFSADAESGVTWMGAMPRNEVAEFLKTCDVGLGWRSARLDSSLEISSKLLEYGASGTSPLLNATVDHERILGEDYPLFVTSDSVEAVAGVIHEAVQSNKLGGAQQVASRVAHDYSFESAVDRLSEYFERAAVLRQPQALTAPRKVLIVSHDNKFLGELIGALGHDPGYELRLDHWESLHKHDEAQSRKLINWADVVFCEWAGPNFVWCSRNIKDHQKLIVRLHGFELRGNWWQGADIGRVDDWVFVSEHFRQNTIESKGVASSRAQVIANPVDVRDFDRPKSPSARFTLGLVGFVSFNKRPDRAVDLLEKLLTVDDRYALRLKGRMPWEYPWVWKKGVERVAYEQLFARIKNSDVLSQRVTFDSFGPDVANWLRGVGIVLSPSHGESFHLAPAEGMASGAVPVIWERPGARQIFGRDNVIRSIDEACERVLALREESFFLEQGAVARNWVHKWDVPVVVEKYLGLLDAERR